VRYYLILVIGVVAISFAAIFIRLAEAPALVIAAYRLSIAAAVLLPFTAKSTAVILRKTPIRDLMLVLLSGILIALHFWLWITSLEYTSIASSVVLVTSHPAFVVLLAYFLWGQRPNKSVIIGILVAIMGIIIMNFGNINSGSQALFGNALAVAAALAMGGYLIIGHHLRNRIDIKSYITAVYLVSALLVLMATFISGYSLTGYSGSTYIMLILLALVPQLIGHSSLNLAVRALPAIIVSVAILGEPVGATILGIAILDEVPSVNEIIGGIIVILGIIYVIIKNNFITSVSLGNK
jgi:drug/metabolite transporter (DMT)-like permease